MDRLTQAKLALAVMAGIFFVASLRSGLAWPRWVAIGLLAVALLLRAVGKRGGRPSERPDDEP